jgi:putative peptide zinc metalloprotease protein
MDSLYSPSWHHVAELRPRVSAQVRFRRHVVRGETWYVIQNPTTGRVHRLTPAAYALVEAMDGKRTTHQVWESVLEKLADDAPTQDESLWVLGLLYLADVLRCDVPPDTAALFRRAEEREDKERSSQRNPLSFRVPLLDPDAFLTRWEPWVRFLYSRRAMWVGCLLIGAAGVLALKNAPELAAGARSLLEPASLVALWFAYPCVKGLHELGHAFAVKRWGGEVHEMGVLFLVFMPVPYVDASASSVLPQKHRRMAVAGAGIAVELLLAALALFVWLHVEPGGVRHAAYAVMLVGGVSTLLFNGNPLLRFDGYYVLADQLEIPNLSGKANQYVTALGRRHLLGLRESPLPETAPGEAPWLVAYAVSAFVYRIGVLFGIALYLATHFFVAGVALALATVFMPIVLPVFRILWFVLTDATVGERRGRAVAGSLGLTALAAGVVLTVPIPLRTMTEGIIWLPEHSHVRAGADGFVTSILAEPNTRVAAGDPLVLTRDPSIETRVASLEARSRELLLRLHDLDPQDRVEIDGARARLEDAEAELSHARERLGEVLMRSPVDGVFVVAGGADLAGRYVEQGEVVGYVVDLSTATARVVVGQEDAAMLRARTSAAWVRLEHDLGTVLPARIEREVPAGSDRLPTRALGTTAGGAFAVDPMDPEGTRTLERVFQFDLALPDNLKIPAAGERVYVRFDHDAEPLAQRGYRAFRRLFLRQLGV